MIKYLIAATQESCKKIKMAVLSSQARVVPERQVGGLDEFIVGL